MEKWRLEIEGAQFDTDAQTTAAFAWRNSYIHETEGGNLRSVGLTVPATSKNNMLLNFNEAAAAYGSRARKRAWLGYGIAILEGWLYVTGYSDRRHELVFVGGQRAVEFGVVPLWAFDDTLTYRDKAQLEDGDIPSFGWYNYANGVNEGAVSDPLDIFPVTNLGHLIEVMSEYLGYEVYFPGGDLDAHRFGIILDRAFEAQTFNFEISGSGYGGWSVSGDTLADAGLQIVRQPAWKRGWDENVSVYAFVATAPIVVQLDNTDLPGGAQVVVCGQRGREILNSWEGGAVSFELQTGQHFCFVSSEDSYTLFGSHIWKGGLWPNPAYTTSIAAEFSGTLQGGAPVPGTVLRLSDLLSREYTLTDYLRAYCNLICATWKIENESEIHFYPFDFDALCNVDNFDGDWSVCRLIEERGIRRYIDGWAQHNVVRFKSAPLVPDYARFVRDYPVVNDYLEEEHALAEIPFNDGEWVINEDGQKELYSEDVGKTDTGDTILRGVMTMFVANPQGYGRALHVQTTTDEGIGADFAAFTAAATTLELRVSMPLVFLLQDINEFSCIRYKGRDWLVSEVRWQDGFADLFLLSV